MSSGRRHSRDDIVVPGDKSISHRALMLAAVARGTSRVGLPLASLDVRSTARVLRQLGTPVSPVRPGATVEIRGGGAWRSPGDPLHCGNSGTTARLLLGLVAGHPLEARFTGDRSLRRRPMRRVTEPLAAMGARFPDGAECLPIRILGGTLQPVQWSSPVASAQVKSAILLAGLAGGVGVTVSEPARSRDHTERMLRGLGCDVQVDGTTVSYRPGAPIPGFEWRVPGDPSSAAFMVAAAVLGRRGAIRCVDVGVNPTRTGFFEALARMGAVCGREGSRELAGEPVADLVAAPAALRAITVSEGEIPAMIDEIPMLACLAARAEGRSTFRGLAELRVKESDRLALLAQNLGAIGVAVAVDGDTLHVTGTERPLAGPVRTAGDHRIAMAFSVLDTEGTLAIDDLDCADVSFPGFARMLTQVRRQVG